MYPGARVAWGRHPASVSCVAGNPGLSAPEAARRDRSGGSPCGGAGPGVSAASRGSAHPRPLTCVAWLSAPEHIHMVLSPPSSGAAQAATAAPRRGPGARGPREAPRGRRRCPRPGSPVPSWLARAVALCAPGESSERSGSRRPRCAPGRQAGGSRRPGARRPLSSPRSPLPAGCAPDRWRNCTDAPPPPPRLLAATLADAPVAPDPEGCERGRDSSETVRSLCPIKGPSGSCGPQPLVRAWEAGRPWVGPPSGLSVTVVAGILACGPRGVCDGMRGWRRRGCVSEDRVELGVNGVDRRERRLRAAFCFASRD
ncbi:hypothetical protein NN561_017735 [Cricetulus griseus]